MALRRPQQSVIPVVGLTPAATPAGGLRSVQVQQRGAPRLNDFAALSPSLRQLASQNRQEAERKNTLDQEALASADAQPREGETEEQARQRVARKLNRLVAESKDDPTKYEPYRAAASTLQAMQAESEFINRVIPQLDEVMQQTFDSEGVQNLTDQQFDAKFAEILNGVAGEVRTKFAAALSHPAGAKAFAAREEAIKRESFLKYNKLFREQKEAVSNQQLGTAYAAFYQQKFQEAASAKEISQGIRAITEELALAGVQPDGQKVRQLQSSALLNSINAIGLTPDKDPATGAPIFKTDEALEAVQAALSEGFQVGGKKLEVGSPLHDSLLELQRKFVEQKEAEQGKINSFVEGRTRVNAIQGRKIAAQIAASSADPTTATAPTASELVETYGVSATDAGEVLLAVNDTLARAAQDAASLSREKKKQQQEDQQAILRDIRIDLARETDPQAKKDLRTQLEGLLDTFDGDTLDQAIAIVESADEQLLRDSLLARRGSYQKATRQQKRITKQALEAGGTFFEEFEQDFAEGYAALQEGWTGEAEALDEQINSSTEPFFQRQRAELEKGLAQKKQLEETVESFFEATDPAAALAYLKKNEAELERYLGDAAVDTLTEEAQALQVRRDTFVGNAKDQITADIERKFSGVADEAGNRSNLFTIIRNLPNPPSPAEQLVLKRNTQEKAEELADRVFDEQIKAGASLEAARRAAVREATDDVVLKGLLGIGKEPAADTEQPAEPKTEAEKLAASIIRAEEYKKNIDSLKRAKPSEYVSTWMALRGSEEIKPDSRTVDLMRKVREAPSVFHRGITIDDVVQINSHRVNSTLDPGRAELAASLFTTAGMKADFLLKDSIKAEGLDRSRLVFDMLQTPTSRGNLTLVDQRATALLDEDISDEEFVDKLLNISDIDPLSREKFIRERTGWTLSRFGWVKRPGEYDLSNNIDITGQKIPQTVPIDFSTDNETSLEAFDRLTRSRSTKLQKIAERLGVDTDPDKEEYGFWLEQQRLLIQQTYGN